MWITIYYLSVRGRDSYIILIKYHANIHHLSCTSSIQIVPNYTIPPLIYFKEGKASNRNVEQECGVR